MSKKNETLILDFLHAIGEKNIRNELFDYYFYQTTILSGSMGNKVGIEEIKAFYNFRAEIFSTLSSEVHEIKSYGNFVEFQCLYNDKHEKELTSETKKNVLASDNSKTVKLLTTLKPTGKTIQMQVKGTAVFEKNKVVFIIVNSNTTDFIKQLFPLLTIPTAPLAKNNANEFIDAIQKSIPEQLSSIEIKSIAFSLCGFSPKQSSLYLHLSYEVIETHIQNAYFKLNCSNKNNCLEKVYNYGNVLFFQQLCQHLISIPSKEPILCSASR